MLGSVSAGSRHAADLAECTPAQFMFCKVTLTIAGLPVNICRVTESRKQFLGQPCSINPKAQKTAAGQQPLLGTENAQGDRGTKGSLSSLVAEGI